MRRGQFSLFQRQVRGEKRILQRNKRLRRRNGRTQIVSAEHVRGISKTHGSGEIVRRTMGLSGQNGRGVH